MVVIPPRNAARSISLEFAVVPIRLRISSFISMISNTPFATAVAGTAAAIAANGHVHRLADLQAECAVAGIGGQVFAAQLVRPLAAVAEHADQPLGDDAAQRRRQQEALDSEIDQARHRRCRGLGVKRRKHEMAGQGGMHGDMGGLGIAHLADHDHVGVMAKEGAQRGCEGEPNRRLHLRLVNPMDLILHRIFNRQDLAGLVMRILSIVASDVVLPLPVGR